jgi:thymidylate kinase
MKSNSDVLKALFSKWGDKCLPFLVLRNHDQLPEKITGDVDILVDASKIREAEQDVIDSARQCGFVLVNRVWFSPLALFFANLETGEQIHIDLFKNLVWRGVSLADPKSVLERRRVVAAGFPVPHRIDESIINLLTRLLYQGKVREKYRSYLQTVFQSSLSEVTDQLSAVMGSARAYRLSDLASQGDWEAIENLRSYWRIGALKHTILKEPLEFLSTTVWDLQRLLGRIMRPAGVLVVMMGPDGAGKSSVAEALRERLDTTFSREKGLYIHWKPQLRTPLESGPVSNPHANPPRPVWLSFIYLVYHWVGFVIGGWLRIFPVKFRNGMVIVDRYFHDLLADPLRYRIHPRTPGVAYLMRCVIQPDLIFVLDAPAEILQRRKAEVSQEETERQRFRYLKLAGDLEHAFILDASAASENVGLNAMLKTLKRIRERIILGSD